MIGGAAALGRGADRHMDEQGMMIPAAMRNFQERKVLCGFMTLKRCDRADMFWGRVKDVELDLVRSHLFIFALQMSMVVFIIFSVDPKEEKYTGNI